MYICVCIEERRGGMREGKRWEGSKEELRILPFSIFPPSLFNLPPRPLLFPSSFFSSFSYLPPLHRPLFPLLFLTPLALPVPLEALAVLSPISFMAVLHVPSASPPPPPPPSSSLSDDSY